MADISEASREQEEVQGAGDPEQASLSSYSADPDREKQALYTASQWQLIWRRFRRHRLAQIAMILLAFLYIIAAGAEFLAPYETRRDFKGFVYTPPSKIHFFDDDGFVGPFVYGLKGGRNESYLRVFVEVKEEKYPVRFLCGATRTSYGDCSRRISTFSASATRVSSFFLAQTGWEGTFSHA